MISYLWNVPNRRLTTGLKNKLKATFEIEQCWFFAVLWWPFWKWRPVEIFRYRESIQVIIMYLHMKFPWNQTMLNLCGIVMAILKMETGRHFSMSGINLGHHNLPTCLYIWNVIEIGQCWIYAVIVAAIMKMATGRNFSMSGISLGHHNQPICLYIWNVVEIGQCSICAVLWRSFWKWRPLEI